MSRPILYDVFSGAAGGPMRPAASGARTRVASVPMSAEERAAGLALITAAQEELHRVQREALAKRPIDHAAILEAHRRYSDVIREVIR